MALKSINPANDELIQEHVELTDEEVAQKIDTAHQRYLTWRKTSFAERAEKMKKLGQLLRENSEEIGKLATLEMGKPISQAIAEVEKSAWLCDYYADNAEKFLANDMRETDAKKSYVAYDPIGVLLAVMPWNFPFWQVFRFIIPAAMAGNVGVLKHASNVQMCAAKMEELMLQAGFPEGVFQNLSIGSSKVKAVIENPLVQAVALTGSEYAGSQVAMTAGEQIKKTVLELGGSDPFIVLPDADLEYTADQAMKARFQNAGQSCIAAKRFFVHESIADKFADMVKDRIQNMKFGDPMEKETEIGPVVNMQAVEELSRQVKESVASGATLVHGGSRQGETGCYFTPTLLTGVDDTMKAFTEETFGPVLPIIKFETEEEVIAMANNSPYGLGGSIWTADTEKAEKIAREINSGSVFINSMVKSDPRLPFGGIKRSGYGRELAEEGIKEFVNTKTIYIK